MSASGIFPIAVPEIGEKVSAAVDLPEEPHFAMILAHGAGAGMQHPFMAHLAGALAANGIGVLRFNFPYMEKGRKRPDLARTVYATLRAVVEQARILANEHSVPLVGAGKSFGGRMLSQLLAEEPVAAVSALVFFGFPLHPAGKPGMDRAQHLKNVPVPMLFHQGSRDALAQAALIRTVCNDLRGATLNVVEGADHGFHLLKSAGITDEEAIGKMASVTSTWLEKLSDNGKLN